MNVTYWTGFSKRKNSTKQPTGGTTLTTVALKDDTSIISPTFDCVNMPSNVNYIYVQDWGRYYFVRNVMRVAASRLLVECECDVLATYKSNIGSLYADVEYTASSSNITITDPRNSPTHEILSQSSSFGVLPTFDITASCYIVGVTDNSGASYYMMSQSKFAEFTQIIFDESLNGQLTRDFFDMNNILISACAMPRWALAGSDTITLGPGAGIHIDLLTGVYRIDPTDRMIDLYEDTKDITYPSDFLGTYGQNYLDASPYTTGTLYLPFVGIVELPVDALVSQKSLYVKATLDQINGDIVYKIGLTASKILATYSGNCAATIPVSGSSYNPIGAAAGTMGVIGGVAGFIAGIASKGATTAIGGLATAAASGAGVMSSLSLKTHTNGSLSSFIGSSLGLTIYTNVVTRKPAETNLTSYRTISGMPYFKSATIGNLSGYVQCSGASVDMPGTSDEKDTVNDYLNSGFYYE